MANLILLRHGKSLWNKQNIFTGMVNIPLAPEGIAEAEEAGKKLKDMPIDLIFTSELLRAHMTASIAMMNHSSGKVVQLITGMESKNPLQYISFGENEKIIPMIQAYALNERCYGQWQGCNKDEVKKQVGSEVFISVRRGYDNRPPDGESLAMTSARTIPFFEKEILPHVYEGKNVLVSAHGNSLRAIVMFLEGLSKDEIVLKEIPTGEPFYYKDAKGERIDL